MDTIHHQTSTLGGTRLGGMNATANMLADSQSRHSRDFPIRGDGLRESRGFGTPLFTLATVRKPSWRYQGMDAPCGYLPHVCFSVSTSSYFFLSEYDDD